jgi:hypothetical protein
VKYFIEDIESTTDEHSGAEGVGVDREGNVLISSPPGAAPCIIIHCVEVSRPDGGR